MERQNTKVSFETIQKSRFLKTKNSDFDGLEVESEVWVEDGILVMTTTGNPCGPIKTIRTVTGDTLVISTTVVDKKVTATRTFKKQT